MESTFVQPLRSAARAALDLGDRVLHPVRRRRARERASDLIAGGLDEVLFVCRGNICRSPFAERSFLQKSDAAGRIEVRSSGFYPECGRSSPPEAVDAARRRGVDLAGHRSRVLDVDTLRSLEERRNLVVVMDTGQRDRLRRAAGIGDSSIVVLGDLDPGSIPHRRIRDPWGAEPDVFDSVFDRIERCVRELGELTDRHVPTG